jgi:cellobiose transport system substrate-binding protein
LTAAGCGSDDNNSGSSNEKITLTVDVFGQFGYEELYRQYERDHPNITIKERGTGANLSDYTPKLTQYLATNAGAGDIVAIEEGILIQLMAQADKFENLLDYGAGSLQSNFLDWKWNLGLTADKKKLVGLGTDIGGLAMCYRSDLFGQAGLASKREDVSKLWSNWDDYARVGKQFKAKVPNVAWIDSATSIMQPYIMQQSDTWFYSKDNKLIIDSNPIVKKAYDFGLQMAADGLTAKLGRWSPDWDAAFKNAAFATVPCPAWMTGVIAERAGDGGKGKWDIATIPGGSGNWGGSYLAIPEQSTHKKEAFELVKYLTGKEGHLASYKEKGTMPSGLPALEDPAFKDSTNEYFSNAPTGQIFGASVKTLKPIYLGPLHQQLWENELEPQMQAAEQGKVPAAKAWENAMSSGKKLAEG